MKRLTRTLICVVTTVFSTAFSTTAHSAMTPLAVSIIPPVQFPPENFSIIGARLSVLWGRHWDVYGVDVAAIGNITEQTFGGLALAGIFNLTRGQTTIIGLQGAGVTNINTNKTRVVGVQLAGAMNINHVESSVTGFQVAPLANISPFTTVRGVQIGAYNRALAVYGLQIGLVNVATNLHGVQIGLLNFHQKGLFSVAPILNVGF